MGFRRMVAAPVKTVWMGVLLLFLTACTPVVDMVAAPDAPNPECASVLVALPDSIGEQARRETNAQATSAWGDPVTVTLRCGVEPPRPTTNRCVNVDGVDWVIREDEERWVFTTYGRVPAIEVSAVAVDNSGVAIVSALSTPIVHITPYTQCL